ncbi:hypothetical protein OCF15_28615 [Bacillus cereus]|nr:hypothetical protein [Bacillus cereus]
MRGRPVREGRHLQTGVSVEKQLIEAVENEIFTCLSFERGMKFDIHASFGSVAKFFERS